MPDFGRNLSQSLSSNHLAVAAIGVYRIALKHIKLDVWRIQFLDPLVAALISESSLIRFD